MSRVGGCKAGGPFRDLVIDNNAALALMKEVVNNDNRTTFWMSFELLIITEVCIFVIFAATVQYERFQRRGRGILANCVSRVSEKPVFMPMVPCAARSTRLLILFIQEKTGR